MRSYASLARKALPAELDWFSEGHRLSDLCGSDDGMSTLTDLIAECVAKDEDVGLSDFSYIYNFHLARNDPEPAFDRCSRINLSAGSSVSSNSCTFYTAAGTSDSTDPPPSSPTTSCGRT